MTCPSPTEHRTNFIFSAVVEEEDEITPLQGENKPRTLHTDPDKDALHGTPTNIEHPGVCDVELQFLILDPSMRPKLPLSLQSESQPVPSMWSDPPVLPSLQDSVPEALVPQHQGSWDMADQGAGEKMQCTDEMDDKGSCIPEVVITQADELFGACEKRQQLVVEKPGDGKQTEEIERAVSVDSSYGDGGDFGCSDQQSLKSDSISLTSEATVSGKSYGEQDCEEDDARSVTASSVTSLFQRLQMDPLEREWLRFAALGNVVALRQLLSQDPALASKKTALHWAAKQGRLDMAEMMAQAGVDVNAKSGYTALHLAAIHGHHHIIQMLINTCSANVNIRDYHGKMPTYYWSGSTDAFSRLDSHSGGKWSRGKRAQRYACLPSLLGSRSRSLGHLSLELVAEAEPPAAQAQAQAQSPSPSSSSS